MGERGGGNLEEAQSVLRHRFGHENFRPGQAEIIGAVLDGYDSVNDRFHVNLGWGSGGDYESGSYFANGTGDWYALPPDNPEIKTNNHDFTSIGSVIYDGSIRNQLQQIEIRLREE